MKPIGTHRMVIWLIHAIVLICLTSNTSQAATTIKVDWALDPNPTSSNETCNYTLGSGALFRAASDGKCTWRRAIREAGARPLSDRPITITFTGLDGSNGDADDVQFNKSQAVIKVTGSTPIELDNQNTLDTTGNITIQGPAFDLMDGKIAKVVLESRPTLNIRVTDVTIENLGFYNGGGLYFYEKGGVFRNNVWGLTPNGQQIAYEQQFANGWNKLAGKFAVFAGSDAHGISIENNVISGAYSRAIFINGGVNNVLIRNNRIGTRIDGSVPSVPDALNCRTFTTAQYSNPKIDPSEWFGGWGISMGGSNGIVTGNLLAGMHNIRTANETPPMALEIFGAKHTVSNNVIGRDANDKRVGVCGVGIKYSAQLRALDPKFNPGHSITDNLIDRSRNFNPDDPSDSALLWGESSPSTVTDGGNTVRNNLVFDSTKYYHRFSQNVSQPKKLFEPAEITSIVGTTVTGGNDPADVNDDPSPCPNCIIDFYLDDLDGKEEALEYLGSVQADAQGNFTHNLAAPIPANHGIRTTSTSTANKVIGNTFAGTTSTMSRVAYTPAPASPEIFASGFEATPSNKHLVKAVLSQP